MIRQLHDVPPRLKIRQLEFTECKGKQQTNLQKQADFISLALDNCYFLARQKSYHQIN